MLNNAKTYLFSKLKTLIQLHNKILFIVLEDQRGEQYGVWFSLHSVGESVQRIPIFSGYPDLLSCKGKIRKEYNVKGTVGVISSDPPRKGMESPIYNGTLKTFLCSSCTEICVCKVT